MFLISIDVVGKIPMSNRPTQQSYFVRFLETVEESEVFGRQACSKATNIRVVWTDILEGT